MKLPGSSRWKPKLYWIEYGIRNPSGGSGFENDLAELVQDRAALFVQKEPQCAAAPTPFTPELNVDYFHSARVRQGRREFPNTGGGRIHPLAPETKKAGIAHFESDS